MGLWPENIFVSNILNDHNTFLYAKDWVNQVKESFDEQRVNIAKFIIHKNIHRLNTSVKYLSINV